MTSKGPYEHCATVIPYLLEPIHNGVCRIATECSPSTYLWEVNNVIHRIPKIYLSSIDMILLHISESSIHKYNDVQYIPVLIYF